MWSRVLVVLSFLSLSLQASASDSQEPGTRVLVRLSETSAQLPDPEKLVQSLVTVGGRHEVRVKRRHAEGQQELTMDLWGGTVPQADIPQTLRDAFPVLASADIQVSALDPKDRPQLDESCDRERSQGEKCQVKKVVKIIKKE
jgi:hypothetical protein